MLKGVVIGALWGAGLCVVVLVNASLLVPLPSAVVTAQQSAALPGASGPAARVAAPERAAPAAAETGPRAAAPDSAPAPVADGSAARAADQDRAAGVLAPRDTARAAPAMAGETAVPSTSAPAATDRAADAPAAGADDATSDPAMPVPGPVAAAPSAAGNALPAAGAGAQASTSAGPAPGGAPPVPSTVITPVTPAGTSASSAAGPAAPQAGGAARPATQAARVIEGQEQARPAPDPVAPVGAGRPVPSETPGPARTDSAGTGRVAAQPAGLARAAPGDAVADAAAPRAPGEAGPTQDGASPAPPALAAQPATRSDAATQRPADPPGQPIARAAPQTRPTAQPSAPVQAESPAPRSAAPVAQAARTDTPRRVDGTEDTAAQVAEGGDTPDPATEADTSRDSAAAPPTGAPPTPARRMAALPFTAPPLSLEGGPTVGTRVVPPAPGRSASAVSTGDAAAGSTTPAAPAWRRNAASAPLVLGPVLGVVLTDPGLSQEARDAFLALRLPVTLAVDPAAPDAARAIADYRAAGYEVLLHAPGPVVQAALADFPQTLGILATPDAPPATVAPARQGHALLLPPDGPRTLMGEMSARNLPALRAFGELDAALERAPRIERYLGRAAFEAVRSGGEVVLGHIYPETIAALDAFRTSPDRRGVTLAPVSVLMERLIGPPGERG